MDRNERTVSSACGSLRLEGSAVPKTVMDSIGRCLRDEAIFDFAVTYVAGARAGYRSLHSVETDEDDPFLYRYSCTPVNKLNIRDGDVLAVKVRDVSAIRIAELDRYPITEKMSPDYLRKLHARLYGDIFSWAGEYRTREVPDRPVSCLPQYIPENVGRLFSELEREEFLSGLGMKDVSKRLAYYICELTAIRPFRDGNGPAVRALANSVAVMNGFYLDYSKASESLYDIAGKHGLAGDCSLMEEIIGNIICEY